MTELEIKLKIADLCMRQYKARNSVYIDRVKPKNILKLVFDEENFILTVWDLLKDYVIVSALANDEDKKNSIVVPDVLYNKLRKLIDSKNIVENFNKNMK